MTIIIRRLCKKESKLATDHNDKSDHTSKYEMTASIPKCQMANDMPMYEEVNCDQKNVAGVECYYSYAN